MTDRPPRLPSDSEDDERDHERDQRVTHLQSERDDDGAEHDAKTDERVGAGVVAVCAKRGAIEPATRACADLRRHEVTGEADQARERQNEQTIGSIGVEEPVYGFVCGDTR